MHAPRLARLAALALTVCASAAQAHIELGLQSAPAGSDFRASFGVEHGCGDAATTAIRIRLDPRIVTARPMAKPGWSVQVMRETVKQKDGTSLQVPREIAWTGGSVQSDFYEEFVMLVSLPAAAAGTILYFPVFQECGSTVVRWIEMPLAGEDPDSLDHPAPSVTLNDGKVATDHAH